MEGERMGIEDPDADVVEQLTPIEDDDDSVEDPSELPLEADPADVAEQREVVPEYDDEPR
jgi:hypothetical protein